MATSGQTLNDRINAARYALAGQGLARCVCKATTEEVIGPKKKHLDYLLACTHEPNVSIPQLANLLIERTNHIQWVVVFKALVTVHHLMSYGNERFIQYLASSNYSFELSTFLDKTSGRDFSMSTFIRRYSRYINEKAISYRMSAFDFCKIKRGNEGVLRLMPIDRLLKTLPILQNQLDALLDFDCSASDLNNGVINACFMLLFRDLIGLFACHNDGIINLLNKYFSLNKKMCREAYDLYKKFLVRMDKVSEFLRVAEVVGIDKDEIPDLRRAPSSLIDALEQHLQNLESIKKVLKSSTPNNTASLGSVSSPESGFALHNSPSAGQGNNKSPANNNNSSSGTTNDDLALGSSFKDDEVRRALEEEARVLSLYGSSEANKSSSRTSPGQLKTNASRDADSLKFAVTTTPKTIDDIFGDSNSFGSNNSNNNNNNDDNSNVISNGQSRTNKTNGLDVMAPFDTSHTGTNAVKQQTARPGAGSIRTAIQSATTTLERANTSGAELKAASGGVKKASDDLFSLLDTSAPTSSPLGAMNTASSDPQSTTTTSTSLLDSSSQQTNPISPFSKTSPFDLASNGQTNQSLNTAPMKPGNPFPDVALNSFPAAFSSDTTLTAQPVLNSAYKPAARQQTGANYTNLGGLEGFGDVLQPTFAAGSRESNQAHGGPSTRPSFTSSSGLSSTGLFKGDLDSTLANLAQNLTFEGLSKPKK